MAVYVKASRELVATLPRVVYESEDHRVVARAHRCDLPTAFLVSEARIVDALGNAAWVPTQTDGTHARAVETAVFAFLEREARR